MRQVEIALAEQSGEPVAFKLFDQSFECLAFVPAGVHADLVEYDGSITAILKFFTGILKDEEEVKRFETFIHGKDPLIPSGMLDQLISKLIEEYAARPFGMPAPSANGHTTTSPSSKARSPRKASRSST